MNKLFISLAALLLIASAASAQTTWNGNCTTWQHNWLSKLTSSVADDRRMQRTKEVFLNSVQDCLAGLLRRQITKKSPLLETFIYIGKDYFFSEISSE